MVPFDSAYPFGRVSLTERIAESILVRCHARRILSARVSAYFRLEIGAGADFARLNRMLEALGDPWEPTAKPALLDPLG
jgi:hypothetical protein